jgi:hypothetical protein
VMWVKWKLVLVSFEIVLMAIQDRCTICGEHVIVKEIILGLPDGTPRWHGSSGSSLQFAWRLVNLGVR